MSFKAIRATEGSQEIVFCNRISGRSGSKSAFCKSCSQTIGISPYYISNHIKSKAHNGSRKEQSLKDLIANNKATLKPTGEDSKYQCIACKGNPVNANNVKVVDQHLNSKKHIGITSQNDEPISQIPFCDDDEDKFKLQREKFNRNLLLKTAADEYKDWVDVRYHFGYMECRFFCTYCEKFILSKKNQALKSHAESSGHKENIPILGQRSRCTLNEFNYRLAQMMMGGK